MTVIIVNKILILYNLIFNNLDDNDNYIISDSEDNNKNYIIIIKT